MILEYPLTIPSISVGLIYSMQVSSYFIQNYYNKPLIVIDCLIFALFRFYLEKVHTKWYNWTLNIYEIYEIYEVYEI